MTRIDKSSRTTSFLRRSAAVAACTALIAVPELAAVSGPASATPTSTPSTSLPLDQTAKQVVASGAVGYMAHVRDGRHLLTARAGLAERTTGRRMGADDQFEIGSNTKTFTSVVILQMVDRGQLSLDDSIEKHLPGLVPGGENITVRRLLNHTSGLFNYAADEEFRNSLTSGSTKVWTPRELVEIALRHDPDFAPGEGWNYSNTGYILAGMIAEKVSGRSLADLVDRRIVRPLGLKRTYLVTSTVRYSGPGFAHGYTVAFDGSTPTYTDVTDLPIGGWAGASGAMVSTPRELATFLSALLGGRLLSPEQLTQMRTVVPVSEEWQAIGAEGYGLGLTKATTPCGTIWGHAGDTLGHHSFAIATHDGRKVAVTDTNTQPTRQTSGTEKLTGALATAQTTVACVMLGKPVPGVIRYGFEARGGADLEHGEARPVGRG